MFKKLFSLFSKPPYFITVQLNEKIQPIDRGLVYEDPLDLFLKENGYGEVTGGGTSQLKTGEISFCDLEIELKGNTDANAIKNIIEKLEEIGAPKGSKIIFEDGQKEISFGRKEGMAIYIDGQNLEPEVYQECDINYVLSELLKLTNLQPIADHNWQGENETALYFYSNEPFEKMKKETSGFIQEYPLCKGARIVQIA